MYVVFGANGNTGKVVASTLLDRGEKVRVVARDASKVSELAARGAEVVTADVENADSVAKALSGAKGVYLLVPPDMASTDLVARGRTIVDAYVAALAKSPVPHAVVLSSVAAQQPSGTGPIVITHYAETNLPKVKGTTFTFVRAAYFMENILANVGAMKGDGVLPVFGGGETYPFPMIATHDIGVIAAEALLAPPQEHAWIELSGPKEYSFADAAAFASKTLGREVKPLVLPIDAMVPTLTQYGISANVAGLYREMTEGLGKGLVVFEGKGKAVRGEVTLDRVLAPALG
ncbi:MAG: NmrA family NAD(P)-binding protein [Deltaproteobacteria bacterium]|nr:NmrA family NAD(P)-binding protein [Deltaproteobacteria bacterium]